MKFYFYLFFAFLSAPFFSELWADTHAMLPSATDQAHMRQPRLMINNCPLAKINGKVISLIDIVKQLDLDLFYYNPDLSPTIIEKYQFYSAHWQEKLNQLIENELILLDAEKKEITVTEGTVRQELENRFGPNVMANLEKVNLDYEEALQTLRSDLTIQELNRFTLTARVLQTLTPERIQLAYQDYLAKNPPKEVCTYQVLSIRGKDTSLSEEIAKKASMWLDQVGETRTFEEVSTQLLTDLSDQVSIAVSKEFETQTSKLSDQHKSALESLSPNAFSLPLAQVSRYDQSTVFRIFHLKNRFTEAPASFLDTQKQLEHELRAVEFNKEKALYIKKLKKTFSYDTHDPKFTLPDNYQPFLLS